MSHLTIREKVAEEIAALSPRIAAEVKDVMVEREVKKRTDAFVVVYDKLVASEKEYQKIDQPDLVSYNKSGQKTDEMYSKGRLDQIAKARKAVDRLAHALDKALDKGDFGDVYNLSSGKAPADDRTGDTSQDDTSPAG